MNLTNLNELIRNSGIKQGFLAKHMGISSNTLRLKLKGKNKLTLSEAVALAKILHLDKDTRDQIFFDD